MFASQVELSQHHFRAICGPLVYVNCTSHFPLDFFYDQFCNQRNVLEYLSSSVCGSATINGFYDGISTLFDASLFFFMEHHSIACSCGYIEICVYLFARRTNRHNGSIAISHNYPMNLKFSPYETYVRI